MQLSIILAQKICTLFIIGLLGAIVVRCGAMKAEDGKTISLLLVYVTNPCMIIHAFQIDYSPERMHDFLVILLAAVVVHALYMLLSRVISKTARLREVEEAALVYSNCGNIIIPLVTALFGPEMVFYCTPFICVFYLTVWTHGVNLISGNHEKLNLKKLFLNINIITTAVGLILFIFKIKLPAVVDDALNSAGSTVGPLSMLLAGMLIGAADLKKIFLNTRAYIVCGLRLLIMPALLLLVLRFSPLAGLPENPSLYMILLLQAAAPIASYVTTFAQMYDRDADIAAAENILSMVFCVLTMPLILQLYQILFA